MAFFSSDSVSAAGTIFASASSAATAAPSGHA
jgi:hypothetical protein